MPAATVSLDGFVLTVNAGSTGVKLHLVDREGRAEAVGALAAAAGRAAAVGHRIVFGGARFAAPELVDDTLVRALTGSGDLAPLHDGPALALIREAREALPGVPHVAVFDGGFHAGLPDEAAVYPVPRAWREAGVRRHGFHGLSVEWATGRAAALLGRDLGALRLVVCHLGGGASATAVSGGRSIDTSMGMTPLDGLVMATRCGALDPGVVLHLLEGEGMDPQELRRVLNEESGMRALAGVADMREIERRAGEGDPDARLALAVYDHRLAATVAAMAASLGGLDAVVFTGGVGEGSARVRAELARRLAFLGLGVDAALDRGPGEDADVSAPGVAVRTLVVHAREELVIDRAVRRTVDAQQEEHT